TELSVSVPYREYELPATALMNDAAGLRVVVVTGDNRLQFRSVTLDRDLGPTVHLSRGLAGDERVIQIASAEFEAGQRVDVIKK
ncbi:MAG TPA: efflux RND transporter periplasmic adaptor subunit, partial [Polyangiaceae bacterium]